MINLNSDKKIFVALSGGVDSSVSAAILQKDGFDVTGVFMKNWSGDNFGLQADCPWERDQEDAEAVCKHLNIPFRSFNFEKDYREKVVEYFFDEYAKGRTPNPDVMCNKEIKFSLFLQKALSEGANMIATGHYVSRQEAKDNNLDLLKGADAGKDQSYFLYTISQEQLSKSLFPVGGIVKSEVRKLAEDFKLPNAKKPDSQGICFIGEINVHDFIKQRLGEKIGEIVDVDSNLKVGEHKGAHFYTIGQREGLRIGGVPKPYFVSGTDIVKNIVYVAMGTDHPALFKQTVKIENLHLINSQNKLENLTASVRYRNKPQSGKFTDELVFRFDRPQRAITPGQSLVIYSNEICLGGGVIESVKDYRE